MIKQKTDILIIGGSATAAAAAIYAARRKVNFKVVAKEWGGEVANSGQIGNYPGFIKISGVELSSLFKKQIEHYKVDLNEGVEIKKIKRVKKGEFLAIGMKAGKPLEFSAKAVLIGTGVRPRELKIKGEKEFRNRGVSYCTTCDGPLFKGKKVAVIGGGNSALESALLLKEICPKVYVINRNNSFNGETIYIDKLKKAKNVELIFNAETEEFQGKESLRKLIYRDKDKKRKELLVSGAFVHIGLIPNSDLAPADLKKDTGGYIVANKLGETSISGIFAAGDVTDTPFNQIAIAVGQGVSAVLKAIQFIDRS